MERLAPPRGAANPVRRYLEGIPPSEEKPVQTVASELNVEPLARIMYGQRELFHSNFLAWFFDTLPELADAVFRNLTPDGDGTNRRVDRERQNLDLVLNWPGAAPLVIENKVFSLPEKVQLDEYREKTSRWKGTPAQHILLSMSPPREPADGWQYLSYQELSERIDLALADSDEASYEVQSVRRYSRVVRLLSALLDTTVVRSNDESVWLDNSQLAEIDSTQTRTAPQCENSAPAAYRAYWMLPDQHRDGRSPVSATAIRWLAGGGSFTSTESRSKPAGSTRKVSSVSASSCPTWEGAPNKTGARANPSR